MYPTLYVLCKLNRSFSYCPNLTNYNVALFYSATLRTARFETRDCRSKVEDFQTTRVSRRTLTADTEG